ncbi:hypothetical protein PAG80_18175 [Klebsiella quasipneumoniae]|uniref:hypothetical protein n=1 Tax=Klebsiella quasipneumoniae TaxID=1463165 RepID=UPI00284C7464|nr:hypothetical protein [Klebsiella quasipneumoniae]MDR4697767.1 hypothetical protein [Klebsiella quasipneumoniae]MDR4802719.1 hypothetical protein [Klebsiella quasipneumoniae]MDR4838927.1 hypothetical protein [Klebsiella quasipneumoniae]MDR4875442.1 hypothetical protein [Klebsiella quasipneumoniae]
MKERGMIFNGEMVRAILDGRKTQTRRIMKVQPSEDFTPMNMALETDYKARWYTPGIVDKDGYLQPASKEVFGVSNENEGYSCPFGAVGDRIWVRETWGVVSHELDEGGRIQPWTPDRPATAIHEMPFGNGYYSGHAIYAADGDFTWGDDDGYEDGRSCWKPSIHMPRAASRILLEITDVRVERLNAISEEDAEAEGIDMEALYDSQDCYDCIANHNMTGRPTVTGAFKYLWESIYGEEGWKSNPWVWVIEFKRIEGGAA